MALLQIRNVPDEVRRALKARAAAEGDSLNSYLLRLLTRDAQQPTVAQVLARAARRAEQATVTSVEAVDGARQERDEEIGRRAGS